MEILGVLELKLIALFGILALGLIFGLLPVLFWKRLSSKRMTLLLSFMNSFTGGVFLSAGLIHLIPDAQSHMDEYFGKDFEYPINMVFTCLGTLVVLSTERIMASCFARKKKQVQTLTSTNTIWQPQRSYGSYDTIPSVDSDDDLGELEHFTSRSGVAPYLLAIALDVHSLFEGFGLGALDDRKRVQNILLAVLAHKMVAAYSLGLSIAQAKWKRTKSVIMISIFAFSTPLGVAIGIIAIHAITSEETNLIQGILVAMAGGTFIFIALVEILKEESFKRLPVIQLFFVFVGVAFMALLSVWV